MRHRRRKTKAIALEMRAEREDKIARRKEALDSQKAARTRKMKEYRARKAAEEAAGGEGGGKTPPGTAAPKTSPPKAQV